MATAAKAKQNTVSLKHLAAALAENHEIPKKQSEAILNDLVTLVTKHLKKGDRIRLVGLGVPSSASAPPAWAATPPRASRFRSKPRKKWRSAPRKN